jgi:hypothetical protein
MDFAKPLEFFGAVHGVVAWQCANPETFLHSLTNQVHRLALCIGITASHAGRETQIRPIPTRGYFRTSCCARRLALGQLEDRF